MTVQFVTLASIIIDDIVLPSGETRMGTLGGAGTHAVAGIRVWSSALGLCGAVGGDFPPALRTRLQSYGVDLSGVLVRADQPTARAWQIFEADDHRTEIFRTGMDAFLAMQPRAEEAPDVYLRAAGWHVQWGSIDDVLALVTRVRRARPDAVICWEPTFSQIATGLQAMGPVLPLCDVVSPNLEEAAQLCGTASVEQILGTLCGLGAPLVALRMGKEGSAIRRASDGRLWRVPAVPAHVVDVTGAGNAYCGGFLVGYVETRDPIEAGLRGAVSASFAVEQFGPAPVERLSAGEAHRRLALARNL